MRTDNKNILNYSFKSCIAEIWKFGEHAKRHCQGHIFTSS